ncbi:MAG: hypothetical protein IJ642_04770 [Oscillospiraceae bacterium]|nr:hypothetical protein [Oscillospiraceae bacterium]
MKKFIFWLIISIIIMFVLPWMVLTVIGSFLPHAGKWLYYILFFTVNAMYIILMGAVAGENIKKLWSLPFLSSGFFLISAWIFFEIENTEFLEYTAIYLLLGTAAMLISMFIKKIRSKS